MNEIDLVLKHLEGEKESLQRELNNCLEDFDYEGAFYFQKAIWSKSNDIMAIRRRMECNLDEINTSQMRVCFASNSIEKYEKRLLSESLDDRLTEQFNERIKYYKKEINDHKNKISLFRQTNRSKHIDNDNLLIGIENLFKEDSGILCLEIFNYHLNYISVLNNGSEFKIEFQKCSIREQERKIHHKLFKEKLSRLGFRIDSLLSWNLILLKENCSIEQIHQIISVICFEIIRPTKRAKCNLIIIR